MDMHLKAQCQGNRNLFVNYHTIAFSKIWKLRKKIACVRKQAEYHHAGGGRAVCFNLIGVRGQRING